MSPDRVLYPLEKFHKFFSALPQTNDMKVLDFGSGPIIQHCISAAANASQIVFSVISPRRTASLYTKSGCETMPIRSTGPRNSTTL